MAPDGLQKMVYFQWVICIVIVNGRDTPYLENAFDTVLKSEDRISVFPAVGGG